MDTKKKLILVVDDDTKLVGMLDSILKSKGYDVATAYDGTTGLGKVAEFWPDLIVLDMRMPNDGDGVAFLKQLKGTPLQKDISVLVLTERENMREFFAQVAVDGFIGKGDLNTRVLLEEIERILALQRARVPSESTRVLLAEHDGHIASILKRMLDDAGYQVEHVTEGPRAIDACHREPRPNIVILRQVLTGMNGNVVASRLHELPSTAAIPVVLYAGSGLGSHKPTGVNILIEDEDPRKILAAARTLL